MILVPLLCSESDSSLIMVTVASRPVVGVFLLTSLAVPASLSLFACIRAWMAWARHTTLCQQRTTMEKGNTAQVTLMRKIRKLHLSLGRRFNYLKEIVCTVQKASSTSHTEVATAYPL